MAAGLDGQRFRFLGYLPRDAHQLRQRLHEIEQVSAREHETQLFIETPYRNERLLQAILAECQSETRLAVAADLTGQNETVIVNTVDAWRKASPATVNAFARRPAVFALLAAPRTGARAGRSSSLSQGDRATASGRQ
jgi:16S rRNA (cytidine1402-2'-O)-methyltransferase